MGNFSTLVTTPLSTVIIPLAGAALIENLKTAMLLQNVFKTMFTSTATAGGTVDRIYTSRLPSYNDQIVPLMELWWSGDTWEEVDAYLTGRIRGRILLPPFAGENYNPNFDRQVAAAFMAWLMSDQHGLFNSVPGLIEIGSGASFDYDLLLQVGPDVLPCIQFTLPFKFDMQLLQQMSPDINFTGNLDGLNFGNIQTYQIGVQSDEGQVVLPTQILETTGQTNP